MKDFDLGQYLAEGWMHRTVDGEEGCHTIKESSGAITSQLGLYRFVEDNCRTLYDLLKLNPEELREPISVAEEEGLSPREFIEEFVEEYGDWVDIAEMLGLTVGKNIREGYSEEDEEENRHVYSYTFVGFSVSRGYVDGEVEKLEIESLDPIENSLTWDDLYNLQVRLPGDDEFSDCLGEYLEEFLTLFIKDSSTGKEVWTETSSDGAFMSELESLFGTEGNVNDMQRENRKALTTELNMLISSVSGWDINNTIVRVHQRKKYAKKNNTSTGKRGLEELKREPKQATKSDLKGFTSKEATLNRAKRAEKGNWKSSIGAFVEKHSAEIGEVSPLGKAALVNYIETKMKPELSDEAKEKVDDLVNSSRSVTDLMFALYNTMLKGAGMGLHECDGVDCLEEDDNFNDEKYPKAEAWLEEHPDIKYFNEVPEQFLQYDIDKEDDPDSENIETAVAEAGYMFISELEAALEGGMDDEYLESCAMNGVINDPTYNPPIDSWDYRIR